MRGGRERRRAERSNGRGPRPEERRRTGRGSRQREEEGGDGLGERGEDGRRKESRVERKEEEGGEEEETGQADEVQEERRTFNRGLSDWRVPAPIKMQSCRARRS